MRGVAEQYRFKSSGSKWVLPRLCVLRRLLPRLRVAANGAAASSRARATAGHYVFLQSKEQGYFPSAHITIRNKSASSQSQNRNHLQPRYVVPGGEGSDGAVVVEEVLPEGELAQTGRLPMRGLSAARRLAVMSSSGNSTSLRSCRWQLVRSRHLSTSIACPASPPSAVSGRSTDAMGVSTFEKLLEQAEASARRVIAG
ncbi:hypothetical protein GUJ93_ZPchr0006g41841 [Zizania palustris]|uniref:Uncharacterized protein n=2 Tax=Zizania palustris TaxID=103762 RepID=A0A8J5T6I2_ZIZPA|nr:hypothetical protein GUJ93_ZPchr0006g41841 [Zizania palustris]